MEFNTTCSTGWLPEYNTRTAFEEYRYDALGRRVLVRTRQEWKCGLNCRNAITRTVWDGDQILYEIRSQGGTSATNTQLEQDTDHFVDQTGSLYFPYGRIVYTHGIGLDDPLSLIRMNYSNVFPGPELVLPLANWQGHYDVGWYGPGPIRCTQYPPITGPTYCMKIDWPAPYMWKTMYVRSRGASGPDSWMGSLIEQGRDESGQMYRRNRYYNPVTGRFTQEDPLGLAGGLNAYGFAGGDPVNFGDPFGLCPKKMVKDAVACADWDKAHQKQAPDAQAQKCSGVLASPGVLSAGRMAMRRQARTGVEEGARLWLNPSGSIYGEQVWDGQKQTDIHIGIPIPRDRSDFFGTLHTHNETGSINLFGDVNIQFDIKQSGKHPYPIVVADPDSIWLVPGDLTQPVQGCAWSPLGVI
jgi:RHS repeat-associated protein